MAEYTLYKGEELIGLGTIAELAAKQGVTTKTMYFYAMPSYQRNVRKKGPSKRMIAIKLED